MMLPLLPKEISKPLMRNLFVSETQLACLPSQGLPNAQAIVKKKKDKRERNRNLPGSAGGIEY